MSDLKKPPTGNQRSAPIVDNPWRSLRKYTDARIGMGRAGISQPTSNQLAFQLDHACAQDAVQQAPDWPAIHNQLEASGLKVLHLASQARDRLTYLQRPDLGRRLSPACAAQLQQQTENYPNDCELCLVIADGLSAPAIEQQALPMVRQLLADFADAGLTCPAVYTVEQGRVAVGDEIADLLQAELLVLLVGERPGLSSPNSLGIYFTYQARLGFSDAQRNCLSNIRPQGLSFTQASNRLLWLIAQARRIKMSGVMLKDNSQDVLSLALDSNRNFLLD